MNQYYDSLLLFGSVFFFFAQPAANSLLTYMYRYLGSWNTVKAGLGMVAWDGIRRRLHGDGTAICVMAREGHGRPAQTDVRAPTRESGYEDVVTLWVRDGSVKYRMTIELEFSRVWLWLGSWTILISKTYIKKHSIIEASSQICTRIIT